MSASSPSAAQYGRGAAILSVGIGATGLVTFGYFALASHSLTEAEYGRITLLWSAVFITVSVLYRPVEQLLSRTIADRDARGVRGSEHLRVAATIQLALAAAFVLVALALREPIEDDLLGGSSALYWILIVAVLAYAASYFARGFLAGHHRFGLYGGLGADGGQLALAVRAGGGGRDRRGRDRRGARHRGRADRVARGGAVGAGRRPRRRPSTRARRRRRATSPSSASRTDRLRGRRAADHAQRADLLERRPAAGRGDRGARGAALAGFAFNVLLIARAPLQLFQAVQTSILPHLTRLRASGETDPFRRSVNLTLTAIAAFAGCVALAMLAVGPWLMDLVFGGDFDYERGGLVLVSIGMGPVPAAATLNQALLAHDAPRAAVAWLAAACQLVPGWSRR